MPTKRRSANHPSPPPEVYEPPKLPTNPDPELTHPEITRNVSRGYEKREVLLPGIDDGPRAFADGEHKLGGKLQYAYYQQSIDVLWCVVELCLGECDALLDVKYADGRNAPPANVGGSTWDYWWYPGTAAGAVDTHLQGVLPTWAEPFANTCNVVMKLKGFGTTWNATVPNFLWRMRTRKVLSPATGLYTYSTSVWDQWYDFVRSPEGKNLPASRVDAASFVAAKAADVAAGRKHDSNMLLLDWQKPDEVIDVFRLMARAHWFFDGSKYFVVADRPGGVSAATYDDDHVSQSSTVDLQRGYDVFDRANKITVWYTDIVNGWQQKPYSFPETDPVGEEIIEEEYRIPFLYDPAQVKELAAYLYYKRIYDARLSEQWMGWTGDRAMGDIVTRFIESRNLTIQFRIMKRAKTADNHFDVELHEFNEAVFAGFSNTDPALLQPNLPDPGAAPPNVDSGSVTWSESLFDDQEGVKLPCGILTFTAPSFSFLDDQYAVYVAVNGGAQRFWFNASAGTANRTAVLWELGSYSITIKSRNRITQELSSGTTIAVTVVGKTAVPADVLGLTGGANGTQAFLWWQPSADKAIRSYEIRRGTASDSWLTAIYIGQTNVTSWADEPGYGGNLRYFVKAIDAASRYSANAATFDVKLNAVGQTFSEAWVELNPHAATFTRVAAGADDYSGLWYGSGNLIMEVTPSRDTRFGHNRLALLTRTFSPATAESERAAGSYASVGAWATAVDDPRRGGAPLWAPLPANAQGEIWEATASVSRQHENRARLFAIEHSGSDTPGNLAVAQPFFLDDTTAPTVKHYGNAYLASPLVASRGIGLRLSSNAINYQQIVKTAVVDAGGGLTFRFVLHLTKERKAVQFASGVATTDGSGLVTVSYSYALAVVGNDWLSIDAAPNKTTFAHILVDQVDTLNKTVRFKSYDAAGAALAGVSFGYKLTDNGGGTNVVWA
jgi:hypothetical protein